MNNIIETKVMYNQKSYLSTSIKILSLIAVMLFLFSFTGTSTAKSLYLLSDIKASPNPIQLYDIAVNGTLTYQEEYYVNRYNGGTNKVALDSDSGYLFVTYVSWPKILLIDSKTMLARPEMEWPTGAYNGLEGIAYNHKKKQLYCVDKGRSRLWVYNWDSKNVQLTPVTPDDGSSFRLDYATAYGIAIDEVHQILYVSNSTYKVYGYSTEDWSLKKTITLNHKALCVAVDGKNNLLYTGAGFVGDQYLSQYNLKTNKILETIVESDTNIGVIDIAVDPNSSKVYCTTGHEYLPGGNNIRIFDKSLSLVSTKEIDGHPRGLAIPIQDVGYNPLNLKKEVYEILNGDDLTESDTVKAGDIVTYRISFDNIENANTVTNVKVVDQLPSVVSFVSASDNGVFGSYDESSHKYTWNYTTFVQGSSAYLDIKVKVDEDVAPMTTITNVVTISSDTTPPVTRKAEVVTESRPLNLEKTIFGASPGSTKWVDINEVVTYNIHVDNIDNNFSATDVIITDYLPEELVFISANEDVYGIYDANSHTYTWSIPSLETQEEAELSLTVCLKEDTLDGITVTNVVTAESVETTLAESSVIFKVGDGPVEIPEENIKLYPNSVRRDGNLSGVMILLEMPQGYQITDINMNELLQLSFLEGGTVEANDDQFVTKSAGKVCVVAVFDKNKLMEAVSGYGPKEIEITGSLTDGGLYTFYTTLNITRW